MFLHLLFIEIRKTLKHPALWLGLGVLVFLLALTILVDHLLLARGPRGASGGLENDLLLGLAFFNWLGILVYAVTGAVIAAFDYPDRSLQLWLTRGVPRALLLSARLTTILFFGWLIVCFAVAAILGLSALSRTLIFGTVDSTNLELTALPLATLRVFWSSLPYLALTVLLAILSRSPLFAAGGTIVYGTVVEQFAPALAERLPWFIHYLPASLAQVLQNGNTAIDRSVAAAARQPHGQAILLIGLIFLFLSLASLAVFSRQDLGG